MRHCRTASFIAFPTIVLMYRVVRAESPPFPSARPWDSSARYIAGSRDPVTGESFIEPIRGRTCSRTFLAYEAFVDGANRRPANHSSRYSPTVGLAGSV